MKKLIVKLIPLILLFGMITCTPIFTKEVSAALMDGSKNEFNIVSYSDYYEDTIHPGNQIVFIEKDNLPLIVKTRQIGFGSVSFSLNGRKLSDSEVEVIKQKPIYSESVTSFKLRIGYETYYEINPSSNKIEDYNRLTGTCYYSDKEQISSTISFRIGSTK